MLITKEKLEQIPDTNIKIKEFVEYNKQDTVFNVMKKISQLGYQDDFLEKHSDIAELEIIIKELKPTSKRSVTFLSYCLGLYAKYINDTNAYQATKNIDKDKVWEMVRYDVKPKLLNEKQYQDLIKNIAFEEINELYYVTLVMSIYEGIFCKDMSVLINLRLSDIDKINNIVNLHNNGEEWKVKVSKELINNLIELGFAKWERRNSRDKLKIILQDMFGKHPDSIFKYVQRGSVFTEENLRKSLYGKLNYITKELTGIQISPTQLFYSGVINRVKRQMDENGTDFVKIIENNTRYAIPTTLIKNEIDRLHYDIRPINIINQIKTCINIYK